MMPPKLQCCGQPRRRPWRSFAAPRRGAATAVISGVTALGMKAPGVAATMVVAVVPVGVATPTTAVEETTAAEAEEARLGEVATREAARISDAVTMVAAAALGKVAEDDETAQGVVPLFTVHPSARPPLLVRTAATSRWGPQKGRQLLPWWMLHPRQRVSANLL